MKTVAIIGGGPAGSACAIILARAGVRTLLYERDVTREKPCGGGVTERAFRALPDLAKLDLPWVEARDFRLVGPTGRHADLLLDKPIRIAPRQLFDSALRREAIKAGAALLEEPVREIKRMPSGGWQINDHAADVAVGAGGMNDPLAKNRDVAVPMECRAVATGRFVPGRFEPRIICRFFPDEAGYAWFFPRHDHASLGIEFLSKDFNKAQAWRMLEIFAKEDLSGVDIGQGEFYGWTGPAIFDWRPESRRFGGKDWLLVGDAAGLVDVTTGEGISYAVESGVLAAQSILLDDVPGYTHRLWEKIVPELAKSARLHPKFYRSRLLRLAILTLSRSRTCRQIAGEMAHGRQSYLTLKRRVYLEMPRLLWETMRGT